MLKLKAFIYRVTGIYLAHKEQCEFIDSERYWTEWQSVYHDGTPLIHVHGIVIGSWQAHHGFVRSMRKLTWFGQWRRSRRLKRRHQRSKGL